MNTISVKSDSNLLEKLYHAAHRALSKEELHQQRVSFIYGNLPKDSTITRDQVEQAIARFEGESEIA